ncbi:hypothetical protein [Streptosporangium sp. NPDC006007]|uniref:hypothetical protein n=1 Tax=Streptosporangium sp. NPDC006007 TaxID=3154575 RepID=UPI0033ADFB40
MNGSAVPGQTERPGGAEPRAEQAVTEIMQRIAMLLNDRWRPLLRFARVNQAVMSRLPAGERMHHRMMAVLSVLSVPGTDPVRQFEARLAVIALILGSVPFVIGLDLPEEERMTTALTVAAKPASGRWREPATGVTPGRRKE